MGHIEVISFFVKFTRTQIIKILVYGIAISLSWGFLFWGYLYDPINAYANFSPEMLETARILKAQGLPTTHLLLGILHCLAVTALALLLCGLAAPLSRNPWSYFKIVLLAGLMGSVYCQLDGPIWFLLPWKHSLVLLLYDFGSWLLLGLVFVSVLGKALREERLSKENIRK